MSAIDKWLANNTFNHQDFTLGQLLQAKRGRGVSVSVCLPARNVEATIGTALTEIAALRSEGLVDQVVVIDAASSDASAKIAAGMGVEVYQEEELCPQMGRCLGKGDAIWRGLTVLNGEVVVLVDSDSANFGRHFVTGLAGPLLLNERLRFVKAAYSRPLTVGEAVQPDGGGRVTELCARPLINRFYPELAGFIQPLSGEVAFKKELIMGLPLYTGYALEIAMLVGVWREAGLDALAQTQIGTRLNSHQPLRELGAMAYAVMRAVLEQAQRDGRLDSNGSDSYQMPAVGDTPPMESREVEVETRPPAREMVVR